MEIELLLRECLRKEVFFHGNRSESHRFKFVEELKNDGEEEKFCAACAEPLVLGPFFECSICQMLLHVSCFKAYKSCDYMSTCCFHFGSSHDQLISTEELKNDDNEGVICVACQEQVEGGPGYKCPASKCNFLLHKSCAQLPLQIRCHPSHRNHVLILKVLTAESYRYCNACGKWCCACLVYSCSECDFNLDITCAMRTQINNSVDCLHKFLPLFKQIHFTCETCGEEGTDFVSLCTICQLFIHSRCSKLPRTIDISRHNHILTLINSLHQVNDSNDILCNICCENVKKQYAAYYCKKCGFVAHLHCTDTYRFASTFADDDLENKSLGTDDESLSSDEKINPDERQHFSHPHNLILTYEEVLYDKLCDGCMHFIISSPFYNCTQCSFALHTTCARLPKKKKHILHPHTLILLPHAPSTDRVFTCHACGHSRHGFVYRCEACDYNLDAQCSSFLETLKHGGHQHSLFLPFKSHKNCNACGHNYEHLKGNGIFVCTACDFALGFECATLPLIARYKYDRHPLALTYFEEEDFEEYYCLMCEEKMGDSKSWFYYCVKCDFLAHPQCILGKYPYIKFGNTYKDEDHQHSITFVRKTKYSPPCDACGKTFNEMALECPQCKFNVHRSSECLQKISTKLLES